MAGMTPGRGMRRRLGIHTVLEAFELKRDIMRGLPATVRITRQTDANDPIQS